MKKQLLAGMILTTGLLVSGVVRTETIEEIEKREAQEKVDSINESIEAYIKVLEEDENDCLKNYKEAFEAYKTLLASQVVDKDFYSNESSEMRLETKLAAIKKLQDDMLETLIECLKKSMNERSTIVVEKSVSAENAVIEFNQPKSEEDIQNNQEETE